MIRFLLLLLTVSHEQLPLTGVGAGGSSGAASATPGFVSAVSKEQVTVGTNPAGQTACPDYTLCVPYAEKVLSGNMGVVLVQYGHATSVTFTATDDQSNSYTCANGTSAAGGSSTNLFTGYCYALNITNSPKIAQVTFGTTAVTNASASPHSFYNIATSSAIDGSVGSCAGTSGTTANCASVTPTVANDLILHFVCRAATPTGNFTVGSGYTFGAINNFYGCASQFEVDSGTGSITPSMTMSSSSTYTALAIAFKSASAGTQPSSAVYPYGWVQRICSENNNGTFTTLTVQCPSTGNYLIALNAYGSGMTTSAMSSTTTNCSVSGNHTWSSTGANTYGTNSLYCSGAAAEPSGITTLTISASGDGTFSLYDVSGAPTTTYLSRALYSNSPAAASTLTMWSATNTNLLSFLPTPTTGLVFVVESETLNTAKGASAPSSCVFDAMTFGGEALDGPSTPGPADQNNGWMHCSISTYTSNYYTFTLADATEAGNSFGGEGVGVFGAGATAIINGGTNFGASTPLTITVPATTAGTTELVGIAHFDSTGRTITKVCYDGTTCAAGNTFTQCTSCAVTTGGGNRTTVWYLLSNPSGKTTITVTASAAVTQFDGAALEIQKGAGSFVEDVGGKITGGTGKSSTACASTGTFDCGAAATSTTGANDFILAPFNSANSITTPIPATGNIFTWVSVLWNGGNDGGLVGLLANGTGTFTPIVTDGGSGSTFSASTESIK